MMAHNLGWTAHRSGERTVTTKEVFALGRITLLGDPASSPAYRLWAAGEELIEVELRRDMLEETRPGESSVLAGRSVPRSLPTSNLPQCGHLPCSSYVLTGLYSRRVFNSGGDDTRSARAWPCFRAANGMGCEPFHRLTAR